MPDDNDKIISSEESESITTEKPLNTKKPKHKKSFWKRLFKFFLYSFIGFMLLIIALLIIIQTSFFKNWLLQYAIDKVNESLKGKESIVYAESIEGSILGGFKLNKVNLVVKKDTLIKFDYLDVDFDLGQIGNKLILVNSLTLANPQINITKVKDENDSLLWNFEYLMKPEKPEVIDTVKKEFDWGFIVSNFEIKKGNIRFLADKNSDLPIREIEMDSLKSFDLENFDLIDLNLVLSADYFPNEKSVNVKNISFGSNSPINIKKCMLDAQLTEDKLAELKNVEVVTGRSNIIIKVASLNNFDPFEGVDYEEFKNKDVNLDLVLDRFNTDDLTFFLPVLNFMKGNIFLDINAKGKYGNLPIEKLNLKTANSNINITGRILNLHSPEDLSMNVVVSNSVLNPNDTKANLPGLPIPDYSHVGIVHADFSFDGKPLRFNSDYDIRSGSGNVNGKTFLDLEQNKIVYRTDMKTKNLDIGSIVKDNELKSNLNVDFIADGQGFDYRTLNAKVNYDMSGSSFYGQNISKSTGKLDIRNSNVDLIVQYSSNSLTTNVKGKVDFSNLEKIKYNLEGLSRNLDVSSFTKDASDKSNLNFAFNVKGEGFEPDNITGNFKFDIAASSYNNFIIPKTPLTAIVEGTSTGNKISLTSNFLDLEAKGQFTLTTLGTVLGKNISNIADEIEKSFEMDSTYFALHQDEPYEIRNEISQSYSSNENLNVKYALKIKDFIPFAFLTGDSNLVFKANLSGEITNSSNNFSFSAVGDINDFKYRDSTLMFSKGLLNLSVNSYYASELKKTNTVFNIKSYDVLAGGNKLDTVAVNINIRDNKNNFKFTGNLDTSFILQTKGLIGFSESKTNILFDTLGFTYKNYDFGNKKPIKLNYEIADSIKNINFENFKIADGNQRIEIKGKYSLNGRSDLQISAKSIKTADLQLLSDPFIDKNDLIQGNIRRFEIKYDGTLNKPVIHIEANSDILSIGEMKLGRLDALINYKDNNFKPDIAFYNPNNIGKFKIYGDVPLKNPLKKSGEIDTSINILEEDVNLFVDANNFQIRLLEQLIPDITDLDGTMNGKVNVAGNAINPLLTGDMKLNKGAFTVDLTGVRYNFDANLVTDKQKLILQWSKLFVPSDERRFITTTGYVDFTNLKLSDIDLIMTGDVKILDDAVSKNELGIYGLLYAGSGNPHLRIKGNSERIDLTGNLILKRGNVIIPSSNQNIYNPYNDNFVYKIEIDSSSFQKDSLIVYLINLKDSLKTIDQRNYDPFDKLLVKDEDDTSTVKQIPPSKFFYNISVTTERNIFINLVIDPKTGQEFFGDVNTNLFINNNENDSMQVRGSVKIGNDSYYKFYRNFKASGSLEFTGNMLNPELLIDAYYETKTSNPTYPEAIRDVRVELAVRGEVSEPKLTWKVLVNGVSKGGDDPSGEALSFIIFGRFPDELNASQRLDLLSSVGANIGTSLISSYLAEAFQDYLPFIINTEISYRENQSGTFASNTDIRFTAELGDATVRFGGQILTDLTNTNVVVDYPLNKLLNIKSISSNLIFQFERLVDPFRQNTTVINFDNRTGALLIYKIKF